MVSPSKDLNLFYKTVIEAIREVDPDTPIVVDSGFYASAYAFQVFDPELLNDSKLIYAIHNYEPSRYTMSGERHFIYPGNLPIGELDVKGEDDAQLPYAAIEYWNKDKFDEFFKVVTDWMQKYKIPANRIYIEEFGVDREAKGAVDFMRDSIAFYNSIGWHWSFYCYREDDSFSMMDYQLGIAPLSPAYGGCMPTYNFDEAGIYPEQNPLWDVIQEGLK